jgi:hypothetical protein
MTSPFPIPQIDTNAHCAKAHFTPFQAIVNGTLKTNQAASHLVPQLNLQERINNGYTQPPKCFPCGLYRHSNPALVLSHECYSASIGTVAQESQCRHLRLGELQKGVFNFYRPQ